MNAKCTPHPPLNGALLPWGEFHSGLGTLEHLGSLGITYGLILLMLDCTGLIELYGGAVSAYLEVVATSVVDSGPMLMSPACHCFNDS